MDNIKTYRMLSNDEKTTLSGIEVIPENEIKAAVVISHGMAEHIERYIPFMNYLSENGILCVGHDHKGHGKSVSSDADLGVLSLNGDVDALINDIISDAKRVHEEYPGIPLILFGHSMGSFIARNVLARADRNLFSAAVICGTGGKNPAAKMGLTMMKTFVKFKGEREYSDFFEGLMFGSYNKKFENRTIYDWLSSDSREVDKYISDPYSGFHFTVSALAVLVTLLIKANDEQTYINTDKNLPILLIAGENDPVGNYGIGVSEVENTYLSYGHNVEKKLYANMRHEILNENGREKVYSDILDFIVKSI